MEGFNSTDKGKLNELKENPEKIIHNSAHRKRDTKL